MEERFTTYPSVMDLVTPSERLSAMPKSQKLNINNFKEKDDSELNENNNPVKIPSKPKIQKEKINLKSFFIPDLFKKEDIEELKQSYSPVQLIYNRIDNYFKRVVGVQFDSNMLIATAEFNINNLEFLIEKFTYPDEILAKLMNALMILLDLREKASDMFNSTFESKNIYSMQGSQTNFFKKRDVEIDFCEISKKILFNFKIALVKLNLIKKESFSNFEFIDDAPNNFIYSNEILQTSTVKSEKSEIKEVKKKNPYEEINVISDKKDKVTSIPQTQPQIQVKPTIKELSILKIKQANPEETPAFYLEHYEISIILEYLNTFYFPFIRLYYHFLNIEQITENKKIEIIIGKPLPVPPLKEAAIQIINEINIEDEFLANNSNKFKILSTIGTSVHAENKVKTNLDEENNNEQEDDWNSYYQNLKINSMNSINNANEETPEKVKEIIEHKTERVLVEVNNIIKIKQTQIEVKLDEAEKLIKPPQKK